MQVTANGISIEVEDHGPRAGEPLLMIMGLGMQLVAWHDDFVQLLVEQVDVQADALEVRIRAEGLATLVTELRQHDERSAA